MESRKHGDHRRRAVLHRGKLSEPRLSTDALSPFFNYGRGFFETVLFEEGSLRLFPEHLERMKKTCEDFSVRLDFDEIEEEKILSLLHKENLINHCSRVKILYAPIEDAARWDTVVTAAPYTRPVNDFTLSVHNEVNDTVLNRYKSLNYGYNLHWKDYYSRKQRSDEVLFLNSSGNILEGSYTNLMIIRNSILHYVGRDQNYLQGIMQDQVLKRAAAEGIKTEAMDRGIPLDLLQEADEILICNSLMLIKRVRKIQDNEAVTLWENKSMSPAITERLSESMNR